MGFVHYLPGSSVTWDLFSLVHQVNTSFHHYFFYLDTPQYGLHLHLLSPIFASNTILAEVILTTWPNHRSRMQLVVCPGMKVIAKPNWSKQFSKNFSSCEQRGIAPKTLTLGCDRAMCIRHVKSKSNDELQKQNEQMKLHVDNRMGFWILKSTGI